MAGNAVSIDNFAFAPATLTVPAGSTVTWTNQDEEPHTVVANDGSFHSPGMGTQRNVFLHLREGRHVRLHLLDPPVHARHRGGDQMTRRDRTRMNRRQLIRHSAWFGAAVVLTVAGGEVISHVAGTADAARTQGRPTLRFAQISDSHIGFLGNANPNVTDTFNQAIDQINGLGYTPDFVIHTGDLTHLATPDQFDQVKQMLTGLNTPHVFTVPGEHDSIDDAGQKYRRRSAPAPAATAGTASTSPVCTSSRW